MADGFLINVYGIDGVLDTIITAPKTIDITHRLKKPSTLTLSLPGDDPNVDFFVLDAMIEVKRYIDSTWYPEYFGFHRTPDNGIQEDDERVFWSYGRSLLDLIGRREIMYPASVSGEGANAYTLKSGPADDVIKAFVRENAGSAATSPPRKRDGVTLGLTVAADLGDAPTWAGARAWKNLLEVISDIGDQSSVDFDVRRTGTLAFEFYTAYPQLGTNRSATVKFDYRLGNMQTPRYVFSRTEESNAIMVLGPGQGSARRVLPANDLTTQDDSPWNVMESTYEASGEQTLAGMTDAGARALVERAAKESFTFVALQTDDLQYGRDYVVGDIVTAAFDGIERQKKVVGAHVLFNEDGETVEIEFSDLPE